LLLRVRVSRIITSCRKTTLSLSLSYPATNEELGTKPDMGISETKEAIDAAVKAFTTWSKTITIIVNDMYTLNPTLLRVVYNIDDDLLKFNAFMQERHDDLGRLILRFPC